MSLAPTAVRATSANPDWDEWDALNLMNRERRSAGLPPLAMVTGAREVARSWSGVMAGENLLRHNPDFGSILRPLFPAFRRFGENVGVGSSAAQLHSAFMASPGHRANVMGDYDAAGVGARWSGTRLWLTVNFVKADGTLPFVTRVPVSRVGGASDPDTSVLASRRLGAGSAGAVVIARHDNFADALAGAPLAAVHRGPVLLTPGDHVPQNVVDEAARVIAPSGTAFILGGPAAISPQVEAQLVGAGLKVLRLAGADRFGTAAAVAPRVNAAPSEAFVVSGVSFPDAVVAGAPAGTRRAPILLVGPTNVPPATAAYLSTRPTAKRVAIGGPAAVGEAVAREVAVSERVSGTDRYATSVAVAQKFFPSTNRLALTSGTRFQDALVAAPEAGRDGYPVILTASSPPNATYDHVARQANRWVFALVVGRPGDITDDTLVTLLS